jgi:hypothetical protein
MSLLSWSKLSGPSQIDFMFDLYFNPRRIVAPQNITTWMRLLSSLIPNRLPATLDLVTGSGSGRNSDGIDGPILAIGVVGVEPYMRLHLAQPFSNRAPRGDASMTSRINALKCWREHFASLDTKSQSHP